MILVLGALFNTSCKKMIEIDSPKTQLTPEKAFASDESAVATISSIYAIFNSTIDGSISPSIGTYCDELTTTSADTKDLEYFNGIISTANSNNLITWQSFYSVVYQSNSILQNIDAAVNITATTKSQVKGEALFLRAVSYFFLVNLYGDVPLLLSTDVNVNKLAARSSIAKVYTQVINDLSQAKGILSDTYPSDGKVRVNKWAASALLSRVYLYQKNWAAAETESTAIITSGFYSLTGVLANVFKNDSEESILQFWTKDGYTTVGLLFIPSAGSIPTYPIPANLLNSFENGDHRKQGWLDSILQGNSAFYYPHKYELNTEAGSNTSEYDVFLRLGEQYLIRAEARAQQGSITGAQSDLNVIRNRAGLTNTTTSDKTLLLSAIEHERQMELFTEWGQRFFDLKRNGHLKSVMSQIKPQWRDASSLFPIPQYEILNNPNLTQNPGY